MVTGEGPVVLRATSVVVVNKGHGILRPPADEACGLAIPGKARVFAVGHGILQDALRWEVKGGTGVAGIVQPVAEGLSSGVLGLPEGGTLPMHVGPKLRYVEGLWANCFLQVLFHIFGGISLYKVHAPPSKSNVIVQPVHPVLQGSAELRIVVVEVRGSLKVCSAVRVAGTIELGVITGDGPAVPIDSADVVSTIATEAVLCLIFISKLVPDTMLVLLLGAPVIDHYVGHGHNPGKVKLLQQSFQILVGAILGVHVVED
mmetsp:Transcript_12739/g.35834  ORF Transcript_12739/g.35834 Transcript_12739/m.35834 type:complete len:259 (-) Transcript_12739:704-1480(-)